MNDLSIRKNDLIQQLQGREVVIKSRDDAAVAVNAIRLCNDYKREVEDAFDEHIKAAHLQHKALLAKKASYLQAAEEVDAACRAALIAWHDSGGVADGIDGYSVVETERLVCDDKALKQIVALVGQGKLPLKVLKIDEKVLKSCIDAGVEVKGVKVIKSYSPRVRA